MGGAVSVPYGAHHRRPPRTRAQLKGRLTRPNYKKTFKKVKTHTKRVTRSRTVVRHKRVHKKSYANDPTGSTFVKCRDAKLKDVKRYITPFQRKVMMATMPEFALKTMNSEFTFICKAGPVGNPSSKGQIVGWNQLAFNLLNPQGIYGTSSGSAMINRLACSSYHSDWVSTGDPFGLFRQGWSSAGVTNSNIPYVCPTLWTSLSNMNADTAQMYNSGSNCRIWQGETHITLELRNPQQFGVRANIYEVGARAKQEIFHQNSGTNSYLSYNLPNVGNPSFSNLSMAVDYAKSPLETFLLGMARKGINQDAVANSRMIGLNDSPDFVDAFRTYKVCSVYVPPGGTLYKSYKIPARFVDTTHLQRNTYDRSTKFLVIKTVPEIQLLPGNSNGVATGSLVGVDNQPGDNPSSYWYSSLHADPHLICSVTQRQSCRVLPSTLRTDGYQQYGWIPAGTPAVAGSYVYQNNDIGAMNLQGGPYP